MTVELRELYQETILDHNRRPRNCFRLESANRTAEGYNPLCGDKIVVYAEVVDEVVKDISFQGAGCAISMASASLMTESVKGQDLRRVRSLYEKFRALVMGKEGSQPQPSELGKLTVFAGVLEFPGRVKCATLAWHTLHAAVENVRETVSTE